MTLSRAARTAAHDPAVIVDRGTRGVAALKFATPVPVRERVYHVEGSEPDDWRWRVDGPNGRASSTQNLAGEWLAGALLAIGEDLTSWSRR